MIKAKTLLSTPLGQAILKQNEITKANKTGPNSIAAIKARVQSKSQKEEDVGSTPEQMVAAIMGAANGILPFGDVLSIVSFIPGGDNLRT